MQFVSILLILLASALSGAASITSLDQAYRILEVSPQATNTEIKSQLRRLLLNYQRDDRTLKTRYNKWAKQQTGVGRVIKKCHEILTSITSRSVQ